MKLNKQLFDTWYADYASQLVEQQADYYGQRMAREITGVTPDNLNRYAQSF